MTLAGLFAADLRQRAEFDAQFLHQPRAAQHDVFTGHRAFDAATLQHRCIRRRCRQVTAGRCRFQHGAGQRMFAALLQGGSQRQQATVVAFHSLERRQLRSTQGQRAGLVEGDRAQAARGFQRLGVLDQDAGLGRDAGAGHDRRRRGQAQRAGAGNDQHGDGVEHGVGPVAGGQTPAQQRRQRDQHHHRHEHRADAIDNALDRRLLGLRVLDQADDARQRRFGTDRRRAHEQAAFAIDIAAGDPVAGFFRDRQRFAADQGFVGVAAPFEHFAVHRKTFPRQHDDDIANAHLRHRHFGFASIGTAHARRRRPQRLQRPDRFGGLALGPRLEPLAHQDERDDHRRGFEVQRRFAVVRLGKDQVVNRQAVTGTGAQRDQQVHVAGAGAQRLPAGTVETRTQPELYRRGQRELPPARKRPVLVEQHAQHRRGQRQRQQRGNQQMPAFAAGQFFLGGRNSGLARGRGVRGVLFLRRHLVTGRGDRGDQVFRRRARQHLHAGGFGGQVDAGRLHAGHGRERLFDATDAGRAAHAQDRHRHVLDGDAVAGFLHGRRQRGSRRAAVSRDGRSFRGQVDAGRQHARHLGQGLFDPAHTGGAGHAGDAEAEAGGRIDRRFGQVGIHGGFLWTMYAAWALPSWQGQAPSSVRWRIEPACP